MKHLDLINEIPVINNATDGDVEEVNISIHREIEELKKIIHNSNPFELNDGLIIESKHIETFSKYIVLQVIQKSIAICVKATAYSMVRLLAHFQVHFNQIRTVLNL